MFGTALAASAALSFWIELMMAKWILPWAGGAAWVWTVCLVFFQIALLAGYAYAHGSSRYLSLKTQCLLHGLLLASAVFCLPILASTSGLAQLETTSRPAWQLCWVLALHAGLPFFALTGTSVLLQAWYGRAPGERAADPYFLYAASNAGSLGSLLSYPFLIEPTVALKTQATGWSIGYGIAVVLILACGGLALRVSAKPRQEDKRVEDSEPIPSAVSVRTRLVWILLAALPSALMVSCTSFLCTDVASVPFLWVAPLAVYLATYIAAFSETARRFRSGWEWSLPLASVALAFLLGVRGTSPWPLVAAIHLVFLAVAGLVCHGRLAELRPPTRDLPAFYLHAALGGALGGMFSSLAAPVLFDRVLEYPLVAVAVVVVWATQPHVGLLKSPSKRLPPGWVRSVGWAIGILFWGVCAAWILAEARRGAYAPLGTRAFFFAGLVLAAYLTSKVRLWFAVAYAAILMAVVVGEWVNRVAVFQARNRYGVVQVLKDEQRGAMELWHGTTLHGRQFLDPVRKAAALGYYHRLGPVGAIFSEFRRSHRPPRVAVVGLGAGVLAAYGRAGEHWSFYEIDPLVRQVAYDTNYFSYLTEQTKAQVECVLGDGRLGIARLEDASCGLILLDAFSSDSIPSHLLTREAVSMYLQKLAPGGFLAFHISNRVLQLEPVMGDLAGSLGLVCYGYPDMANTPIEQEVGKEPSQWVVLARSESDLPRLLSTKDWREVKPRPDARVWTDDYGNVLGALRLLQ